MKTTTPVPSSDSRPSRMYAACRYGLFGGGVMLAAAAVFTLIMWLVPDANKDTPRVFIMASALVYLLAVPTGIVHGLLHPVARPPSRFVRGAVGMGCFCVCLPFLAVALAMGFMCAIIIVESMDAPRPVTLDHVGYAAFASNRVADVIAPVTQLIPASATNISIHGKAAVRFKLEANVSFIADMPEAEFLARAKKYGYPLETNVDVHQYLRQYSRARGAPTDAIEFSGPRPSAFWSCKKDVPYGTSYLFYDRDHQMLYGSYIYCYGLMR